MGRMSCTKVQQNDCQTGLDEQGVRESNDVSASHTYHLGNAWGDV